MDKLELDLPGCRGIETENVFGQRRTYRAESERKPIVEVPDRDAALWAGRPGIKRYRQVFSGYDVVDGKIVRE